MDFKTVLIFLSVAVAVSLAQSACCFPEVFEIKQDSTFGILPGGSKVLLAAQVLSSIAADYAGNKTSTITQAYVGKTKLYTERTIKDYTEGKMYRIDDEQSTCSISDLQSKDMKNCISPNATYFGTNYLGDRQMEINSFSYPYVDIGVNGKMSMSITVQDCIPNVSTLQADVVGASVLMFTEYYNFVNGIRDRTKYFHVPSYCKRGATVSRNNSKYDHILSKLSLPFMI